MISTLNVKRKRVHGGNQVSKRLRRIHDNIKADVYRTQLQDVLNAVPMAIALLPFLTHVEQIAMSLVSTSDRETVQRTWRSTSYLQFLTQIHNDIERSLKTYEPLKTLAVCVHDSGLLREIANYEKHQEWMPEIPRDEPFELHFLELPQFINWRMYEQARHSNNAQLLAMFRHMPSSECYRTVDRCIHLLLISRKVQLNANEDVAKLVASLTSITNVHEQRYFVGKVILTIANEVHPTISTSYLWGVELLEQLMRKFDSVGSGWHVCEEFVYGRMDYVADETLALSHAQLLQKVRLYFLRQNGPGKEMNQYMNTIAQEEEVENAIVLFVQHECHAIPNNDEKHNFICRFANGIAKNNVIDPFVYVFRIVKMVHDNELNFGLYVFMLVLRQSLQNVQAMIRQNVLHTMMIMLRITLDVDPTIAIERQHFVSAKKWVHTHITPYDVVGGRALTGNCTHRANIFYVVDDATGRLGWVKEPAVASSAAASVCTQELYYNVAQENTTLALMMAFFNLYFIV